MLIFFIIGFGMLAGWLAQMILGYRGRPNAQSLIAGIAGSFVGGLLFSLLAGDGIDFRPSGVIGTILGAIIVVAIWGVVSGRPDPEPEPTSKRTGGGNQRSGNPKKRRS